MSTEQATWDLLVLFNVLPDGAKRVKTLFYSLHLIFCCRQIEIKLFNGNTNACNWETLNQETCKYWFYNKR